MDEREWLFEARELLRQLDGVVEAPKKKATILALARAEALHEPKTGVFNRSNTCSQTIYYTKWQYDPLFAKVESEVLELVRSRYEEAELAAIKAALHITRMAAPQAAQKQVALLEAKKTEFYQGMPVAEVDDNSTQRMVAKDILDSASPDTASKEQVKQQVSVYLPSNGREEASGE